MTDDALSPPRAAMAPAPAAARLHPASNVRRLVRYYGNADGARRTRRRRCRRTWRREAASRRVAFYSSDERPRCSYGERKNNAGCRGRSVATASHGGRCVAARQIDTTELKAAHDDPRHERPTVSDRESVCSRCAYKRPAEHIYACPRHPFACLSAKREVRSRPIPLPSDVISQHIGFVWKLPSPPPPFAAGSWGRLSERAFSTSLSSDSKARASVRSSRCANT